MTDQCSPLLSLSDELILHVGEMVEEKIWQAALAQTCHRLYELITVLLYRRLAMTHNVDQAKRIHLALLNSPQNASLVRKLLFLQSHQYYSQAYFALRGVLEIAPNLRELVLESSACSREVRTSTFEWQKLELWILKPLRSAGQSIGVSQIAARPLQTLQSLTLHVTGMEELCWAASEQHMALFLHPTLRYLRISRITISQCFPNWTKHNGTTPLQSLILEESNITHVGLRRLLRLPKKLECLHLGESAKARFQKHENIKYRGNHLFTIDAGAAVDALKPLAPHLKELIYVASNRFYKKNHRWKDSLAHVHCAPAHSGGFADFAVLQRVVLVGVCPNFEQALVSITPPPAIQTFTWMHSLSFIKDHYRRLKSLGLPPSIPTTSDYPYYKFISPFFRVPDYCIPRSLREWIVVGGPRMLRLPNSQDESYTEEFRDAGKTAREQGFRLRIFRTESEPYPQPRLGGNEPPEKKLFFDSDEMEIDTSL